MTETQNDYYERLVEELDKKLPPDLFFVEVGTASGTSALRVINALGLNKSKRFFITVDPYGDKPYRVGESENLSSYDYNDDLYRSTKKILGDRALDMGVNHTHFKMRSQDFIELFPKMEFWSDGKILKPEFALAFLDGEHSWTPVKNELRFFYNRMPSGGVISIDDYNLLGGGEERIREEFSGLSGEWFFNTSDEHYRSYFTKI